MSEEASPLSYCHSCGDKTLTDLQTLTSQWRLVLLCSPCLHLVLSAATCSYCFTPISRSPSVTCLHCSCRVHVTCAPHQRRHPSYADPTSFSCVDCSPHYSFSRLIHEKLVAIAERKKLAAAKAKEKAKAKRRIAVAARENARKWILFHTRPVEVEPKEDALMKYGRRRDEGNNGGLLFTYYRKKVKPKNGGEYGSDRCMKKYGIKRGACVKVELCEEDKGFFDNWVEPKEDVLLTYSRRREKVKNEGLLLTYYRRRVKPKNGEERGVESNVEAG